MKQQLLSFVSILRYVPKRASLVGAITLGVLAPAVTFAWGPSRDTYTMEKAATHVVFNSITNNPVQGDERNFMQVREAGTSNSTYADSISLKPDTEYVVYIYYHNNANTALNKDGTGKAKGTYVRAQLPDYVDNGQKNVNAEGYVGATNAKPKQVFDEIYFSNSTGSDLKLAYVPGSATIHNKGKTNGDTLSDSIVTSTGAPIGYDKLNGVVPGCSDFAGYVTLRVKTSAKTTPAPTAPSFTVTKDVRQKGTTTWTDSVAAKPGDTLEYLVTYTNTGSTVQNNITLKDTLAPNATYVTGSSKLKNGQNPAGKTVGNGVMSANGINIGNYDGGGVGYLTYEATIKDTVACGQTSLINGVTATSGTVSKVDTATANVTKTCTTTTPPATTTPPTVTTPTTTTPVTTTPSTTTTPVTTTTTTPVATTTATPEVTPTPLPSTGPGNLLGGAFGMGSLGLGVHHYLASRRALRGATKL